MGNIQSGVSRNLWAAAHKMPSSHSSYLIQVEAHRTWVCTYESAGVWSQGQWGQHPCQAGLAFMSRAMWLLFSEHPQRRHAVKGVSLGECPPQQMEPECEWSHRGGIHCPTGHNGHVVVRSSRNQVLALLEATCTYRHLHPGLSHVFPGEFKPRLQGHR